MRGAGPIWNSKSSLFFQTVDTDGNGVIDLAELLGKNVKPFAVDATRAVSLEEWLKYFKQHYDNGGARHAQRLLEEYKSGIAEGRRTAQRKPVMNLSKEVELMPPTK